MKNQQIMKSIAEAGKLTAIKQSKGILCRTFIYQPKIPAKLLEMRK